MAQVLVWDKNNNQFRPQNESSTNKVVKLKIIPNSIPNISTKNSDTSENYPSQFSQNINMDEPKSNENIIDSYLMFNGENKTLDKLKIGDELMGADSNPCKILDITKVKEKSYLVSPVKGESFIIGESEILSIAYSGNKNTRWDGNKSYEVFYFDNFSKKTTRKSFNSNAYGNKENAYKEAKKFEDELIEEKYFSIFVNEYFKSTDSVHYKLYTQELDFPHTEFDIDPYIIGMWLGDGTTAASHITSADPEIIDYFREYFEDFGLVVKSKGISHNISTGKHGYPGCNAFTNYLKSRKIWDNKHIPLELLLTSRKNRLRLLAGLLDSDGSLSDNVFDFIQKRERLFDEFVFLCRSLGFSCYKSPCVKVCTNAPGGPKAGNYFRCCVSGEGLEEIPTLLNRKKAHERRQIKRTYVTGFTLKDIGEKEIYRIVTDTPLFLMSNFIVRHRYENENENNNDDKKIIVMEKDKITNLSYGYKKVKDGIEIDEFEAKVIIFIFECLDKDVDKNEIVSSLNNNGISKRGEIWNKNLLNGVISYKENYLGGLRKNDKTWPVILDPKYSKNYKKPRGTFYIPYGYIKKEGIVIINEEQANVIRFIFEEKRSNASSIKLAEKLNIAKIPTIKKSKWSDQTIRQTLAHKDKYLGGMIEHPDGKGAHWPIILDSKFAEI